MEDKTLRLANSYLKNVIEVKNGVKFVKFQTFQIVSNLFIDADEEQYLNVNLIFAVDPINQVHIYGTSNINSRRKNGSRKSVKLPASVKRTSRRGKRMAGVSKLYQHVETNCDYDNSTQLLSELFVLPLEHTVADISVHVAGDNIYLVSIGSDHTIHRADFALQALLNNQVVASALSSIHSDVLLQCLSVSNNHICNINGGNSSTSEFINTQIQLLTNAAQEKANNVCQGSSAKLIVYGAISGKSSITSYVSADTSKINFIQNSVSPSLIIGDSSCEVNVLNSVMLSENKTLSVTDRGEYLAILSGTRIQVIDVVRKCFNSDTPSHIRNLMNRFPIMLNNPIESVDILLMNETNSVAEVLLSTRFGWRFVVNLNHANPDDSLCEVVAVFPSAYSPSMTLCSVIEQPLPIWNSSDDSKVSRSTVSGGINISRHINHKHLINEDISFAYSRVSTDDCIIESNHIKKSDIFSGVGVYVMKNKRPAYEVNTRKNFGFFRKNDVSMFSLDNSVNLDVTAIFYNEWSADMEGSLAVGKVLIYEPDDFLKYTGTSEPLDLSKSNNFLRFGLLFCAMLILFGYQLACRKPSTPPSKLANLLKQRLDNKKKAPKAGYPTTRQHTNSGSDSDVANPLQHMNRVMNASAALSGNTPINNEGVSGRGNGFPIDLTRRSRKKLVPGDTDESD